MSEESQSGRELEQTIRWLKSDKNVPLRQNKLAEKKYRQLALVEEMILLVLKNLKQEQRLRRKLRKAY